MALNEDFERWLTESGFFDRLTERQRSLYQAAKNGMAKEFTAGNVMEHLGCTYGSAMSTLNGLVELQVFEKRKMGPEWVFFLHIANELKNGSEKFRSRSVPA
ncbi:hypothetical protein JFT91_25645 [Pseudomonas sp. TH08]|nr:hypothetical protein [Pseudomonas sp. TH06]MBK5535921.1 hypothetical protein [Pseudomonas sp. TH08]